MGVKAFDDLDDTGGVQNMGKPDDVILERSLLPQIFHCSSSCPSNYEGWWFKAFDDLGDRGDVVGPKLGET